MRTVRSKSGFTMLEVLTVMVLIAVVASIVSREMQGALRSSVVRGGVEEFITAYEGGRAMAIRYGRTVRMNIDAANRKIWFEADTSLALTGTATKIGEDVFVGEPELKMGSSSSLVCFDGLGASSTASGCASSWTRITFQSGARADTVWVLLSGKLLR